MVTRPLTRHLIDCPNCNQEVELPPVKRTVTKCARCGVERSEQGYCSPIEWIGVQIERPDGPPMRARVCPKCVRAVFPEFVI
jgi:hypothetical protein